MESESVLRSGTAGNGPEAGGTEPVPKCEKVKTAADNRASGGTSAGVARPSRSGRRSRCAAIAGRRKRTGHARP